MNLILATYTLWLREVVRFARQRNRVIGAFAQPVIFWILIGSGMNSSFQAKELAGVSYMEYFYPGIILMIVLFTSIFSTITIIEDRKTGFMQGVLVAPLSRSSIVLGKVAGGISLSLLQSILFLAFILTPMVHFDFSLFSFFLLLLCIIGLSFGLTTLGVLIAWPMDSIQGYHAIMSVFLFPLWIFSGAAFPVEGTPAWLYYVMQANPLTHGLSLLRYCFYYHQETAYLSFSEIQFSIVYFAVFCLLTFLWAVKMVKKSR